LRRIDHAQFNSSCFPVIDPEKWLVPRVAAHAMAMKICETDKNVLSFLRLHITLRFT